ncbi:MAG: iron-siderophore ABC transporter substrate-binding protein [Cyanobacteria bacterium P01_A01_bin.123]
MSTISLRHFQHWLLSLLVTFTVIACSSSSSPAPTATDCHIVSHALGDVEICGQPQKVVVLGAHSLDLLLSLGEQPAGFGSILPLSTGEQIDQPETQIPYLGQFVTTQPINVGSGNAPSLELLAQFKPDLIVGEAGRNRDNYDLLAQIAPTLLWDVRTQLGQWQQNIRTLAQALGDENRAEEAIAEYDKLVAAARKDLHQVIAASPKALVLGADRLNSGNLIAITPRSYLGELMESLGFELVAPPSNGNSAPLSIEALPELDEADHIFVLGYDLDTVQAAKTVETDELLRLQTAGIQQDWAENAIAQSLTATKADQVYFATYYKWNGLNGPIGTELILDDLRQLLLNR